MKFLLFFFFLALVLALSLAKKPVKVVALVRGKKYEVEAETVEQLQNKVESLTGISSNDQTVFLKGKLLTSSSNLSESGVKNGDVLNVFKGKKKSKPTSPSTLKSEIKEPSIPSSSTSASSSPSSEPASPFPGMSASDIQNQLDQLFQNPEVIEEFFSNDEKLEASRQELLQNLDMYENMMPGFKQQAEQIVNSPEKWKEAMQNAKKHILQLKEMRDQSMAASSSSASSTPSNNNE